MTFKSASNVAILYWGSRGGPVRQLINLIEAAQSNSLKIHWIVSQNIQGFGESTTLGLQNLLKSQIPGSKFRLIFDLILKRKVISTTVEYLEENNIDRIFLLMPHPWDLSLAKKLSRIKNIEIWRGIHDLNKHPGDIWPTKRAIKKSIKFADTYVSFSSYTASQLKDKGKRVIESAIHEIWQPGKSNAPEGSVLFVGRIRSYKGLLLLSKAWQEVKTKDKSLTIAGEGRGIPFKVSQSIKVLNFWLTDEQIENLIRKHRIVVLPYIQASQSGIIPIANSLGVPVVVTPVGGLPSQVKQDVNGIISKSLQPKDLAHAIDSALSRSWKIALIDENPLEKFLFELVNYK